MPRGWQRGCDGTRRGCRDFVPASRRDRADLAATLRGVTERALPAVAELRVADDARTWERLGFALEDGVARVGAVAIRPVGAGDGAKGIVGWSLRDAPDGDYDGLATAHADGPAAPAGTHPNGARSVDHVVVLTPDRQRTSAVLDAAGLGLRRVRTGAGTAEQPTEQAFHRAGEVLVEVVGPPAPEGPGPARFWGLVCAVADLDALALLLGDDLGPARDAVQPGRRIATVRRSAGSTVPLAFISGAD